MREERLRLGVSQADAALLGAVRREQWSHYENGAMPNAEVLVRLIAHGFDVAYILGGSRTLAEGTVNADEAALLEVFRNTDAEGRAAILRAAQMEQLRAPAKAEPYARTSKTTVLSTGAPPPVKAPARRKR